MQLISRAGNGRKDAFVLREFPLAPGDVFEIDKARKGLSNLSGTKLFEFVYLELTAADRRILLTIRLKERPSQLVRFGLRADDERQLQGLLDIRDENFHGTGMELGLTVAGGERNSDMTLEYKAQRLFDSYLTFGVNAFHRVYDSYMYATPQQTEANSWKRDRIGEYREIRYGFGVSFGSLLERLGNASAELLWQNVRLVNLDRLTALDERYRLVLVRLSTVVDTKNSYPFPTNGVDLKLSARVFDGRTGKRDRVTIRSILCMRVMEVGKIPSRFIRNSRWVYQTGRCRLRSSFGWAAGSRSTGCAKMTAVEGSCFC